MNVLTVNCGSSSLKVRLSAVDESAVTTLVDGSVEAIGPNATVSVRPADREPTHVSDAIPDHASALRALLTRLGEERLRSIDAVGHRVVQGGAFVRPAIIDDEVVRAIDAGRRLAPLHNGPSLAGVLAAGELLPHIPMVAVFDTTFHVTMPDVAARYALPQDFSRRLGLRRYGYHGIAHRSMTERYAELTSTPYDEVSIVTLQLGSGCSVTAVHQGTSVDTSMGFTPLEGLMMGTRAGDLDPGAVAYVLRETGTNLAELEHILNEASGLLGVSGTSADMAVLLEQEAAGHARAHAAIEMFCYRARKYIGAYFAVLGRVQAVVFGGGIGERAPEVRRRICEPLQPLGVEVDGALNTAFDGGEGRFSREGSPVGAWVIPSDEERMIARDTFDVLSRSSTPVEP